MDSSKTFNSILFELIEHGEDKEELEYWMGIYPDLPTAKQEKICKLFSSELEKLKELDK